MPQLLFFVIVGALAYAGYRALLREAERVTARARRAEREMKSGSMGTLVKDPETGVYTPAKD